MRLGDAVAARLRAHELAGRTVTIKVRFGDFRTITRSSTLAAATDSGPTIAGPGQGAARRRRLRRRACGSSGVSVSGLAEASARQLTLDDLDGGSWDEANQVVDAIRARFGAGAIGPATLTGAGGLRLHRKGDQQWGPRDQAGPGAEMAGEAAPVGEADRGGAAPV